MDWDNFCVSFDKNKLLFLSKTDFSKINSIAIANKYIKILQRLITVTCFENLNKTSSFNGSVIPYDKMPESIDMLNAAHLYKSKAIKARNEGNSHNQNNIEDSETSNVDNPDV